MMFGETIIAEVGGLYNSPGKAEMRFQACVYSLLLFYSQFKLMKLTEAL